MEIKSQIFLSKVMHKRFFPKVNSFSYNVYYIALPLDNLRANKAIKINKFGLISFYEKDHGKKDGSDLNLWVRETLQYKNINISGLSVLMVTFPRILGYVFNPISFFFCYDTDKNLKAVLCEVNNTFHETHNYICIKDDNSNITENDILETEKLFHVSPFLKREGNYKFRFDTRGDKLGVWIDYHDSKGDKELITSLLGKFVDLNKSTLRRAFITHPLVTFRAIFLIHYQAIKLMVGKVRYINKPPQLDETISTTSKITKS